MSAARIGQGSPTPPTSSLGPVLGHPGALAAWIAGWSWRMKKPAQRHRADRNETWGAGPSWNLMDSMRSVWSLPT
jgi:hypothetical protein